LNGYDPDQKKKKSVANWVTVLCYVLVMSLKVYVRLCAWGKNISLNSTTNEIDISKCNETFPAVLKMVTYPRTWGIKDYFIENAHFFPWVTIVKSAQLVPFFYKYDIWCSLSWEKKNIMLCYFSLQLIRLTIILVNTYGFICIY
jgi:hypothetical protein